MPDPENSTNNLSASQLLEQQHKEYLSMLSKNPSLIKKNDEPQIGQVGLATGNYKEAGNLNLTPKMINEIEFEKEKTQYQDFLKRRGEEQEKIGRIKNVFDEYKELTKERNAITSKEAANLVSKLQDPTIPLSQKELLKNANNSFCPIYYIK